MFDDRPQSRSHPQVHTLDDLVAVTGFSVRQIRYYISQDLVPGAEGRGPSATYPPETLQKLQLVKQLKEEVEGQASRQLTLKEIRRVLDYMDQWGDPADLNKAVRQSILDAMPTTTVKRSPMPARSAVQEEEEGTRSSALDYLKSLSPQEPEKRIEPEDPPAVLSFQPLDARVDSQELEYRLPPDEDIPSSNAARRMLTSWLAALISVTSEPLDRSRSAGDRPLNWRRVASDDPDLLIEINVGQPVTKEQRDRLKKLTYHLKKLLTSEG